MSEVFGLVVAPVDQSQIPDRAELGHLPIWFQVLDLPEATSLVDVFIGPHQQGDKSGLFNDRMDPDDPWLVRVPTST